MENVIQSDGDNYLLPVREVVRRLGVARRTLEREISRKRFPRPLKIGSKSVYRASDVEAYVKRLVAERDAKRIEGLLAS
jgi:predicted DNA-binding transcriptional regulator AlpA